MTECSQSQFPFEAHFSRQVMGRFDGSQLTTDGGRLLLRQADRKIGLLQRVTACFTDHRRRERVEHELHRMLAQRIYGLALGYEDLNDHEQLRQDPLLALLAGKREITEPLAGKSTLNRMELTPAGCARGSGRPTRTPARAAPRKSHGSSRRFASGDRRCGSCCEPTRASVARS